MSKTVNGPYNIVRLEGDVGGKKKIIYLFSDIHVFEDECDDIDSLDINKYLLKVFRKAKKKIPDITYDFFVEAYTRPEAEYIDNQKRSNYLLLVRKMFYHLNRKKRILSNEMNIRLHYTDFRDYLGTYQLHTTILNAIGETDIMFSHSSLHSGNINNIITTIAPLTDLIKYTQYLINAVLKKIDIKDRSVYFTPGNVTQKQSSDILNNIFEKIRNNYSNKMIKSTLVKILSGLNPMLKSIMDKYNSLLEILNSLQKIYVPPYPTFNIDKQESLKTITDIKQRLIDINTSTLQVGVILIDIFMLRRFLDKDYITNAIYYCGGFHANFIATTLIQYFDFKITHIAKSDISVDELNKQLKTADIYNAHSMEKLFKPSYQCSSLEGFPDLLT